MLDMVKKSSCSLRYADKSLKNDEAIIVVKQS